jgi:hypothetical protein
VNKELLHRIICLSSLLQHLFMQSNKKITGSKRINYFMFNIGPPMKFDVLKCIPRDGMQYLEHRLQDEGIKFNKS